MSIILIIFLGQCVIAAIVIIVLKKLLDRELMNAALEKFESCKASADIKEITVLSSSRIKDEVQGRLESIRKRKFVQAKLIYRVEPQVKGGIVIALEDILLDFSLSSRLQNFWT